VDDNIKKCNVVTLLLIGYRYELYCIAKSTQTPHCVVSWICRWFNNITLTTLLDYA